jgi:hypothetical protein
LHQLRTLYQDWEQQNGTPWNWWPWIASSADRTNVSQATRSLAPDRVLYETHPEVSHMFVRLEPVLPQWVSGHEGGVLWCVVWWGSKGDGMAAGSMVAEGLGRLAEWT